MDLITKRTSATPAYIQIADILKKQILSGELATGEQLPGEHQLAARFETSRVTLRKGLQILEEQKLILQRRGIGAFVTYNMPRRHCRIAILEILAPGEYGDSVLAELMPALSQLNECEFTVLRGADTPVETLLHKLNEHACDGLIAIAPSGSVYKALCRPEFNTVPTVVIGLSHPSLSRAGRAVVDIEPDMIGKGVEYLVKLRHRKIAYLSCNSINSTIRERNRDFRRAAGRFGLFIGRDYILEETVPSWYDAARDRIRKLCLSPEPPTAVITAGAIFAYGAWQGIMDAGKRIPEDISILGVECSRHCNPHLSAILQPLPAIARGAAEIMMTTLLSGKNMNTKPLFFPVTIEERGSCIERKTEEVE